MTQENNLTQPNPASLGKRMLIGAGIGLLLISVFLFPTESRPEWGKFWMVRPLIVVPFAGAMGGLCNYVIFTRFGLNKIVAGILSVLVFLFGLWIGTVLGLQRFDVHVCDDLTSGDEVPFIHQFVKDAARDFGGHIFVSVGPLIEVGGAGKSKGLEGIGGVGGVEAADGVDGILGQAEGSLGIVCYFVKAPARGVGSCLVEQGR